MRLLSPPSTQGVLLAQQRKGTQGTECLRPEVCPPIWPMGSAGSREDSRIRVGAFCHSPQGVRVCLRVFVFGFLFGQIKRWFWIECSSSRRLPGDYFSQEFRVPQSSFPRCTGCSAASPRSIPSSVAIGTTHPPRRLRAPENRGPQSRSGRTSTRYPPFRVAVAVTVVAGISQI